ncbi:MAG: transporter [Phycisphaeraceae bacterium]|nr:transporter [Phycisphaeraceae bacterium]
MTRTPFIGVAVVAAALVHQADAQEAINAPAATLPSPGALVTRFQFRAYDFKRNESPPGQAGWLLEYRFMAAYGILPELAVEATLPFFQREMNSDERVGADSLADSIRPSYDDHAIGLGDLDLGLKLRVWRADLGPVDTMRLALLVGLEIPTGTNGFGSSSVDPYVGAAFTGIFGRHGLGAAVKWTFNTGEAFDPLLAGETRADLLELDLSYLFRVYPEEYGELHEAAWYAVGEINTTYETNADWQIFLSPGLLIEAPRWAFELGVQIPVYQRVSDRPEMRIGIVAGLRLLF